MGLRELARLLSYGKRRSVTHETRKRERTSPRRTQKGGEKGILIQPCMASA